MYRSETLFIGHRIIELNSVGSTNSYASELLNPDFNQNNVIEGTIVLAWSQYSGRGQRGYNWKSEPFKNLTLSIILYPAFLRAEEQFMLNKVISLGVCDYVCKVHPCLLPKGGESRHSKSPSSVKIKWPNDINIGDEKVAGILIENSIRNNKIVSSVIGIGLNVNQTRFSSAIPNPASLKLIIGKDFDLRTCLSELCSFIEARYLQLRSGKIERIDSDYLKSLYRYMQESSYEIQGKRFSAKITGVSNQGKLVLEKKSGTKVECDFKEIKFI
ncbi:MAG: biotin--[acetyl-CoA-carboxylase] ligase [Bacteroidota bacterium]